MPWHRLITRSQAAPRCKFYFWLISWQKLPTLDRLCKWKLDSTPTCKLCEVYVEDHQHFFLDCRWTSSLRLLVFSKLDDRKAYSIQGECLRVSKIARKKSTGARVYLILWAELLYEVWLMRCRVMY